MIIHKNNLEKRKFIILFIYRFTYIMLIYLIYVPNSTFDTLLELKLHNILKLKNDQLFIHFKWL